MKSRNQGFTLVEIAIVLVIIGLLLGGILKGQEMINQAKIKNVVADFSGVSAAYYGYQDRYRAIPGDDAGAGARWAAAGFPATPATGAYGDGVVAGTYNTTTANEESRLWWLGLRTSGFVSGGGQNQPFNAVSGMLGVQTGNNAGGTVLGGFGGIIICSAGLPDKIAISVDTQMDDGAISTGSVRGQLHTGGPNPAVNAAADAAAYAETGTNIYMLCRLL